MRICKVKNCDNKYHAKGYCKKHYAQQWKHGKILKRTTRDKNEIINCGDYYKIVLYSDLGEQREIAKTKIDKDDLEKVKNYKWHLDTGGYVNTNRKFSRIRLHTLILGEKEGYETDHINHDKLDNRKQNLRFATRSQNCMNRKSSGIYWHKIRKKWVSQISINYKTIYLGLFRKKEDAIKKRKEAEQKYFGEFAYKN